ncbi:MAG TPA: DUF1684 domain-containing protein [Bryobacteraceae bacterium]|nr:DUF1684 domain-containing protein [Bryobacteraceae bacterium]
MHVRNLFHICCWLALSLAGAEVGSSTYRAEIQKWREGYEADLKRDNGWLTLAGLFWLKEGRNTFGTGAENDIVLPPGSAPGKAGAFLFHDGKARLALNGGAAFMINGKPDSGGMDLKADSTGAADRITNGRLRMIVIQRGKRFGIRLWDNDSAVRRNYPGSQWFPVQEAFRVTARFTSYPQPKMVPILNVLGDTEPNPSPGYATFELQARTLRLEPLLEGDHLFFILKDLTSGKETYAAGRFLYTGMPKDGKLILDFNKAENPPCAFTPYATCPLPPKQNYLPVAVTAGERKPANGASSH